MRIRGNARPRTGRTAVRRAGLGEGLRKLVALVVAAGLLAAPLPLEAAKKDRRDKAKLNHPHDFEFGLHGFKAKSRLVEVGGGAYEGVSLFEAPWGETMTVEAAIDADTLRFLIDGDLTVEYLLDVDRKPVAMRVEDDGVNVATFIGDRARRYSLGLSGSDELDTAAYEHLTASLLARHTPEFLGGLRAAASAASAPACACWGELGSCSLAITAWGLSLAGLILSCGSGLVPACIVEIIAHELASASVVVACTEYLGCLSPE